MSETSAPRARDGKQQFVIVAGADRLENRVLPGSHPPGPRRRIDRQRGRIDVDPAAARRGDLMRGVSKSIT
jgi:hypothetical protein